MTATLGSGAVHALRLSRFLTLLPLAAALLATSVRAETVPFTSGRWRIEGGASRIEPYLGRESLWLKGGTAWLEDVELTDGIIEFDIAVNGERGFMGAVWRMQDVGNREEFYIRPHHSGNPDACQYTPVHDGLSAWQLYHGEGYGAQVEYRNDVWMHVRIVISGSRGEIHVDSEEPLLHIRDMKRPVRPGRIGVFSAEFAHARFANFTWTAADRPALRSAPAPPAAAEPGTVRRWLVTAPFHEGWLDGRTVLTETDTRDLTWGAVETEPTGILNIASVRPFGERRDTVFARLIIRSDADRVRRLSFGWSDRVRAWVNGRLVFGGTNLYRSRDYRYLGTIGLFDDLYLPLRKGNNELWLAVSESFGGWGLLARFESMDGIELVAAPAEKGPAPADP